MIDLAELLPGLVKHKCSQCRNPIPKHKSPKYLKSASGSWMKLCGNCYGTMTMESPSEVREKKAAEQAVKDERQRVKDQRAVEVQKKKIALIQAKIEREREKRRK